MMKEGQCGLVASFGGLRNGGGKTADYLALQVNLTGALADKEFVSTVFAPNNDAVETALA